MTWAKFDDRYDGHPKVRAALKRDPVAAALHPSAITASARYENDGLIDETWLEDRVPQAPRRRKVLEVLVELRLVDELPPGAERQLTDEKQFTVTVGPFSTLRHIVHDFLDYNPSSAQLKVKRERDAQRKRDVIAARNPKGGDADSNGIPDGGQAESEPTPSGVRVPRPDPTRPDPKTEADASVVEAVRPDVVRLCQRLADAIRRHDPKAKVAPEGVTWRTAMRLLLTADERTESEVAAVIDWCQADGCWWAPNIMSAPKLREKFTTLLAKMREEGAGKRSPAKPVAALPPMAAAGPAQQMAWQQARSVAQTRLDGATFGQWIAPLQLLGIADNGALVIGVPGDGAGWVNSRHGSLLRAAAHAEMRFVALPSEMETDSASPTPLGASTTPNTPATEENRAA